MQFVRKHSKLSILIVLFLVGFLIVGFTFARYIYNDFGEYILETKGFYFNSSVLSVNNQELSVNDWDGVNSYTVTIDLNNQKNSLKKTDADINYNVAVSCDEGITCTPSKSSGTILSTQTTDSYQVVVTTSKRYNPGESTVIHTSVTSTSPYTKTMSADYRIGVETNSFTYSIEDTSNEHYFILNLTNSIPYYKVSHAFDTYSVGDTLSLDKYNALDASKKAYCFSAVVTLSFDPNIVFLDMTNTSYLNRLSGTEQTTSIGGFNYVSRFQFKIAATSSEKILFYKADRSKNYTYPGVNSTSIINVTTTLAN